MAKKVNCYLNYYPSNPNNTPPKSFNIHPDTQIELIDLNDNFVIAMLNHFSEQEGFATMIEKVPIDVSDNLFFYAIPYASEIDYFRRIEITNTEDGDSGAIYKFRIQSKDNMKVLNDKFKKLRGKNDKLNFVYKIQGGGELPVNKVFHDVPELTIIMEAAPKLVTIEIYQNSQFFKSFKIGLNFFKKTAETLLKQNIIKNLNRNIEQFVDYDIYYEYNHSKIPQDSPVDVKTGDVIKLHLNSRRFNFRPQNTVDVEVTTGGSEIRKKRINIAHVQNKAPIEIASWVVNSNEKESFYNEKIEVKVDNQPFEPNGMFKKGKLIEINFTNIKTKEPSTYAIASPSIPATVSQTPQFVDFKTKLKRLLGEADSDKNDIEIKRLLATYMVENMFR